MFVGISQEYSSLFHHSDFDFCVFTVMDRLSLGPIMQADLLMCFCMTKYIGTQGEDLSSVKVHLVHVAYATDHHRSKTVVPVLF